MTLRSAVFLDRDGVLIESNVRDGKPFPVTSVADVRLVDGTERACTALSDAGLLLVLVTNQPDVARGTTRRATVDEINEHIRGRLGIDHVRTCDHDDADRCHCRKPMPGMLLDAARDFGIDLASSVMVGDRAKDILAGRAAGCATVLVDGGHGELAGSARPDAKFGRLEEAVEWVVAYADRARRNDSSSRSPSTEPTS